MKKHFVLCLSLCLFLSSHPVHAWDEYKDNKYLNLSMSEYQKIDCPTCGKIPDGFLKNWKKDKAYLENIDFYKDPVANCDLAYNVLWYWSKKGNLDARSKLFISMAIAPLSNSTFLLPTTSIDRMTYMRQAILLALYQIGSEEENSNDKFIKETADQFIFNIEGLTPDSDFGKCMGKERSQKCVEEAVKEGLIPSFDRFAREIDALYAAGFMPICAAGVDPHENALVVSDEPVKQK